MGRLFTAFRAFFASLFDGAAASRIKRVLENQPIVEPETVKQSPKAIEAPQPVATKPRQSEAITLLATLQREARLVDFLQENLSDYSDAQVGAAVREIHRDSAEVLKRFFAIRPILTDDEGASVEVPKEFDAARYRLTGKLAGEPPFRGTLRHHGWEVTLCELPAFTGSETAAKTIAPAEVELS